MDNRYNLAEVEWPTTPFPLDQSLVLAVKRGSEANGTYIPPADPNSIDDRDIMGIIIPPARNYVGLGTWEGADSIKGCWDVVFYEFRKFVNLLMKQNPNVLLALWVEPEDILYLEPAGRLLIQNRDLFRQRTAAFKSFLGYATSQLQKMEGGAFKGYMGEKRKALVEKYGYDTKNAAHLIRLLNTGIEYLRDGKLNVKRTHDRDMLIDIKTGKWKLEDVKMYAYGLEMIMKECYEHSVLPDEPIDFNAVEELVMKCIGPVISRELSEPTNCLR